jgi:hypothetical protein
MNFEIEFYIFFGKKVFNAKKILKTAFKAYFHFYHSEIASPLRIKHY